MARCLAALHIADMAKAATPPKRKKTGIGERIEFALKRAGLNYSEAAREFKITRSAVSQWVSETTAPDPDNLEKLSSRADVDFTWLRTGRGTFDGIPDFDDGPRQSDSENIDFDNRPKDGILEIDVRAGLGAGGSTEGREVRHDGNHADPVKPESWKFPTGFMRNELRAQESQVIILETDGDSMEPTIGSGERIIVHTGMRQPSPDGIFALRDSFGNIIAKRLQVLRKGDPPRVLVISDNKAHATEEVGLDEIAIVGRVLWGLKRL